ncbi:hypothetical protein Tco_0482061 [Tanacetum coccineum]
MAQLVKSKSPKFLLRKKKVAKLGNLMLVLGLCKVSKLPMRTPGEKKFEGSIKQKVFRAKKMAYERVVGSYSQQYAQLRDYCMELKEKNPNTTVKIEVEPPEDPDSEERKQKGVIPAIAENFPNAEHRFCLKHIYDNMKLSWRGKFYKEMLWKCATASTIQKVQDKCDGPLTPSTAKIFKLIVRAAAKLKVEWNGSDLYQVTVLGCFILDKANKDRYGIQSLIVFRSMVNKWKEIV